MRIIRLSRAPPIPPPLHPSTTAPLKSAFSSSTSVYPHRYTPTSTTKEEARKSYLFTVISTFLLATLLAISLTLTLLPLLLPSIHFQSLAYFTIRPTGVEKGPKAVAINLNDIGGTNVTGIETRDEVSDGLVRVAESAGGNEWLGVDGPSIYVGVLQICSRSGSEAEVNCTSSSQADYHSSLLPLTLRPTLLSLHLSPPTPILLLISAILLFLATAVFLAGLIPWKCSVSFNFLHRKPPLPADPHWSRSHVRTPYQRTDARTDSSENLVQSNKSRGYSNGRMIKRERPHLAFFTLILIALGLTAGSLVQLRIVRRAQNRWDSQEAMKVGMIWELGVLTYLLPILPICLILVLLLAASPCIYTYLKETFHTCPADHDIDDDDPIIITNTGNKVDNVGKRWNQTPIINPSPVYIPETYDLPQVRMESKRSTMESVGKAL
ncbi:hypothetical protein V865_001304 [Kwoniella europaea PYCC6329]|uniref:Uncharacterized protein n=1 Tax=Kwoniella europaea PYCC6329 TaxID=1423913 RepID=A0AAX4KBI7_9TREE